jgi:plastocyanin
MMRGTELRRALQLALVLVACLAVARAQKVTARGRVELEGQPNAAGKGKRASDIPQTVVWLTAAPGSDVRLEPPAPIAGGPAARLTQRNKSFEPHLLVIPVGSTVEFPNRDPFFHNVFSLFDGKRFDLGLYEAGTSRSIRFDRPGVSYIFCNIHPEMSAVVVTMATPLYAVAGADGTVNIANVPYGRYTLRFWSQGMSPESDEVTREITISETASSLGVIRVPPIGGQVQTHKNMYGRDYDQPTPDTSIYPQH